MGAGGNARDPQGPAAAVLDAARMQDELVRAHGYEVWLGAEPTFTRRESEAPCWLFAAEGGDKLERAQDLARTLAPRLGPATQLWRVRGRHYPGEPEPRFSLGLHWPRTPDAAAPSDGVQEGGAVTAGADAGGDPLEGPLVDAPPLDPGWAWLTITPDPAVVEVNLAPAPDLATFAVWTDAVYAAAAEAGLSPLRYRYNGDVVDSGGGGQISFGGPTPLGSPFFRHAGLLPGLVRYLNRHPSLSYLFAGECVGSASQGPRADEGVRERFEELEIALGHLEAQGDGVTPDRLWSTLSPLLVDCSGNTHRAEINVEKVWNPEIPDRGRLGVVELRSLRMEPTPERLVAVASLFRAVILRLLRAPFREPLVDWGAELHDRFALPTFLGRDRAAVLADLDAAGVAPAEPLRALLEVDPEPLATVALGPARLRVTPALEFWPLVGDVASQEAQTSRLVDASSRRVEVRVAVPRGENPGELSVGGRALPLVPGGVEGGDDVHLIGVRYRSYEPRPGLHPGLGPHEPLPLVWTRGDQAVQVDLFAWRPEGGGYPGLPADAAEAARRRAERLRLNPASVAASAAPPPPASGRFTIDLRALSLARRQTRD